ncbi:ADP-ribosyltransferase [Nitratireductor sp. OM-1]|uniref:ADP-ribosyltransferase n=1 Tax=Nitratireductor sp. OM-1 TaxID=1756988 RepID=UPI000DDE4DDD|nr:ADP-ribosyltransferase [Nitratireductor sp. OM-1]
MPVKDEVFIAIEEAVGAALSGGWADGLSGIVGQLYDLMGQRRWYAAHELIDTLDLDAVVPQSREQLEELAVSAVLFGASHAAGGLDKTSYLTDGKALPQALSQALDQLDVAFKHNIAEEVRWELHRVVTEMEEEQKYALLHKDDMSHADLVEAGLATPDEGLGTQTLYVHRPLINSAELIAWAREQGFEKTLEAADFHVTVCFSRQKLDWTDTPPLTDEVYAVGGVRKIERFGKAIVLTFESAEIEDRHEEFKAAGASHDFPEYNPHVTISYAGGDFDISKIEPFEEELVFGAEEFAPVKENWSSGINERFVTKAETKSLAQRLNDAVLSGRSLVDVNANLTTSRLISLGFLSEAVEKNVTTYQVNEVLDDVTCAVCREMHGKSFTVVSEYSKIMTALSTSDPQELRNIAPWPKNTKAGLAALREMNPEEMQLAGYGSPPYHPGCRGFLVQDGTVTVSVPMQPKPAFVDDGSFDGPNGFDLSDEVDNEILLSNSLKSAMSAAEEEAFREYTENAYHSLNKALRNGDPVDAKMVSLLDGVFSRVSLDAPMVVYRQVDADTYKRAMASEVFEDLAYVSTTADKANLKGSNIVRVEVPQGSRAVPVGAISEYGAEEAELLLARGSRFHVRMEDGEMVWRLL